ncbi:MAG: ABC transporter ATP-binding protein [Anaerolineales bacterium]|jgi:lipopolysaccharide transport system ATP-binding protein
MTDIAIKVENLSKIYRIGVEENRPQTPVQTARSLVGSPFSYLQRMMRPPTDEETLWALKDVSFEVKRSEVVGIIGRNGAGKSTLLKILSRITEPTSGRAEIRGRVGSLLEVGTGFHPELTGRENIYLSGALLGMRREEIDRQFDEIVDFSGIERFIDTPIKRYSSGMNVRLGFALAAHLHPDILLIDEVLAVGDAEFQKKCLGKMGEVAKAGRTILFVSHNMAAIMSLCQNAILIDEGRNKLIGSSKSVVGSYLSDIANDTSAYLGDRADRSGNQTLKLMRIDLSSSGGEVIQTGNDLTMSIAYKASPGSDVLLQDVHIAANFRDRLGMKLFHLSNGTSGLNFNDVPSEGAFICHIPSLQLMPGTYSINLFCAVGGDSADKIEEAVFFEVHPGDFFGNGRLPAQREVIFAVPHSWRLKS